MNACILVLGLLQCIVSQSPPSTPAEAAAILAPHQFTYAAPVPGPTVTVIYSSPTAGPFGEFAPFAPARRLDGTLIDRPPTVYGQRWPSYGTPIHGTRMDGRWVQENTRRQGRRR